MLYENGIGKLLAARRNGEFALPDARTKAIGETRGCILAIRGDKFVQRSEECHLCEAIAIDAVEARFLPRLRKIGERRTALLFGAGTCPVCEMKRKGN